jgi:predicted signal transduction protein with EAL and GGDEF domain
VGEALAAAGLAPDRLTLEVTESTLVGDTEAAHAALAAIKALGWGSPSTTSAPATRRSPTCSASRWTC